MKEKVLTVRGAYRTGLLVAVTEFPEIFHCLPPSRVQKVNLDVI